MGKTQSESKLQSWQNTFEFNLIIKSWRELNLVEERVGCFRLLSGLMIQSVFSVCEAPQTPAKHFPVPGQDVITAWCLKCRGIVFWGPESPYITGYTIFLHTYTCHPGSLVSLSAEMRVERLSRQEPQVSLLFWNNHFPLSDFLVAV